MINQTSLNRTSHEGRPAYQWGNSNAYLAHQSTDGSWHLEDRIDRSMSSDELQPRYGWWRDQPQPDPQAGLVTRLARGLGFPCGYLKPDGQIQPDEVTPFADLAKFHFKNGLTGGWTTYRIDVQCQDGKSTATMIESYKPAPLR